jgi:S1-C subfamily serine protease
VSGPADAAALAGQFRPGQSVGVTVRRNGQQLPLAITLGP